MREIHDKVSRWLTENNAVACAQVIKTWGSSPRVVGSVMAVNTDMSMLGSVSGGCIEGNVVQAALECLDTGLGRIEKFHASTKAAHEVGLSCGGDIDILIAKIEAALFAIESEELDAGRSYAQVSLADESFPHLMGRSFLIVSRKASLPDEHDKKLHSFCVPERPQWQMIIPSDLLQEKDIEKDALLKCAQAVCASFTTIQSGCLQQEGLTYFCRKVTPMPTLVCVGGVHISMHLTRIAKTLGYRTVVIDPRGIFSTSERFPSVDELIHAWPQEAFETVELHGSTALCALTHDPKIDVPALAQALDSDAFYIGSLGRTTTQWARYKQLQEIGYSDEKIQRIYGPIGLDLKGKEPAEIALAIMAEITAVRYGACVPTLTMAESAHRAKEEKALLAHR